MYIQSKYKQTKFIAIDLASKPLEKNIAESASQEIKLDKVSFKVSSLTTSNFCLFRHHTKAKEELSLSLEIKSSFTFVLVILNGVIEFEDHQDCKTIDEGGIYYGCGHDIDIDFKIKGEKDFRAYAYFFKTDYIINLLQNENWGNGWSFMKRLALENENLSLLTNSVEFDAPLYHTIVELGQQDPKTKLELSLMELGIKKLFLQFRINETRKTQNLVNSPENLKKIKIAHQFLLKNFTSSPTIKQLSREVLLNELQLKKDFKKVYGTTIRKFIIDLKMKKAITLLEQSTVAETAHQLGYKSIPHFINTFKDFYGFTPGKKLKK